MQVITDNELNALLANSPAPRVTADQINARVSKVEYTRIGETVTICSITLDNKFSVHGESACVNPENYNRLIGEKISYENAFVKLWGFFGFLLAEKNALRASMANTVGVYGYQLELDLIMVCEDTRKGEGTSVGTVQGRHAHHQMAIAVEV